MKEITIRYFTVHLTKSAKRVNGNWIDVEARIGSVAGYIENQREFFGVVKDVTKDTIILTDGKVLERYSPLTYQKVMVKVTPEANHYWKHAETYIKEWFPNTYGQKAYDKLREVLKQTIPISEGHLAGIVKQANDKNKTEFNSAFLDEFKLVLPSQIIELIKKLPDSESHIFYDPEYNMWAVTQEWLCGNFAGRAFYADTVEQATKDMIDYFYQHQHHPSMVGDSVKASGFPNLEKVYKYCKPVEDEIMD